MDDALGNYALTLVDALDVLPVMCDFEGFEEAVKAAIEHVSFDVDARVNVFEVTIRMLGGLLSSHHIATVLRDGDAATHPLFLQCRDRIEKDCCPVPSAATLTLRRLRAQSQPTVVAVLSQEDAAREGEDGDGAAHGDGSGWMAWYDGELLAMALDLGLRLLPAFQTSTGIPKPLVNLHTGSTRGVTPKTCLAGAGTLLLEFSYLSKLSGYPVFQEVSLTAMKALCNHKTSLDLVGSMVSVNTGFWTDHKASIGAGSDSFYEYLLKGGIFLDDGALVRDFETVYEAVELHLGEADWYYAVDGRTGVQSQSTVDSLQAFWPGLQVLHGDVAAALRGWLQYLRLWRKHLFLPEVYVPSRGAPMRGVDDYPLRPEFAESTYLLHRASGGHPLFLSVGEEIVRNLQLHARVPCGFASVGVSDLRLDDRMDSFFLSETLKYLFLLFSPDHWLHSLNYIFTTEGHPFPIPGATVMPALESSDPSNVFAHSSGLVCLYVDEHILDDMNAVHAAFFDVDAAKKLDRYGRPSSPSVMVKGEGKGVGVEGFGTAKDSARIFITLGEGSDTVHPSFYLVMEHVTIALGQEGGGAEEEGPFRASPAAFGAPFPGGTDAIVDAKETPTCIGELCHGGAATAVEELQEMEFVLVYPEKACGVLHHRMALNRSMVCVVVRGQCSFSRKAANVQRAGCGAMLVVDNEIGPPESPFHITMTPSEDDDAADTVDIPCGFVSQHRGKQDLQSRARFPLKEGTNTHLQLHSAGISVAEAATRPPLLGSIYLKRLPLLLMDTEAAKLPMDQQVLLMQAIQEQLQHESSWPTT